MKLSSMIRSKQGNVRLSFHQILFLISFTIVLGFAVFHLDKCLAFLQWLYALLSPLLLGIIFAFLLNIPMKLFEQKIFAKLQQKNHPFWNRTGKYICLVLSLLLVIGILAFVSILIVPELIRSVSSLTSLVESVPDFWNDLMHRLNTFLGPFGISQDQTPPIPLEFSRLMQEMMRLISSSGESILALMMGLTTGFFNVLISLTLAIYLLAAKEKLIKNLKCAVFAFLPYTKATYLVKIGTLTGETFSKYVSGQFIDGIILGILCYVGMTVLRTPYPLLVSVIVAMTGLIPVFGSFIGGAIGGLIILVVSPSACLWFLLFLIILQNFESNFIYPRVMGSSVGLPGVWVIFSLIIFGKLFGFLGVLIGIPTFSVIYRLFRQQTEQRLQQKNISLDDILHYAQQGDPPFIVEEQVAHVQDLHHHEPH